MKNKTMKAVLALCLCSVMLAGCGSKPVIIEEPESTQASVGAGGGVQDLPQEEQEPVELTGQYAKAAYLADMVYEGNQGGNTMVSPLSLDMALGLVADGANGQTKEELLTYLGTDNYGEFAEQYMEYAEDLNADPSSILRPSHYKMAYEIANSIWVKNDRKLVDSYVEKAEEQFEAEINSVSFEPADVPDTVKQINDWCNEKTHELIPQIINEDAITKDLSAILINSLYFECPWTEEWGLTMHSFTDLEGNATEQEMLRDTLSTYYENEYATAFAKGYQNGMYFIGILPKETGEFKLADLDIATLMESETVKYDVHALMPKLNFDTTATNIVDILKSQGVETVFDGLASDMSGFIEMRDDEVTYISDIIQKTKIELDENGTKAAAVTAVMLETVATAMPVEREEKYVYLDRPFAFMIYDEVNEQIVFMGKVVTP